MAYGNFSYGYGDRARSGEPQVTEKRPIILKECAKCHDLVDRETLFAGVCPRCPPPKVVHQLDGPEKF